MQSITLALIVYIALSTGLINKIISMIVSALQSMSGLTSLHIDKLTITSMLQTLTARMELGVFPIKYVIGILIYMAVAYALSVAVFSRKELEL